MAQPQTCRLSLPPSVRCDVPNVQAMLLLPSPNPNPDPTLGGVPNVQAMLLLEQVVYERVR